MAKTPKPPTPNGIKTRKIFAYKGRVNFVTDEGDEYSAGWKNLRDSETHTIKFTEVSVNRAEGGHHRFKESVFIDVKGRITLHIDPSTNVGRVNMKDSDLDVVHGPLRVLAEEILKNPHYK